jgi:cytochrome c oxidase subunit 1
MSHHNPGYHDHYVGPAGSSWWTKYVFSQDAKYIGTQYALTALFVGLVGMVLSWGFRLQLGFPGQFSFMTPASYYQAVTMHGMIMIVFMLTAFLLGTFGNWLIPLMVGARDMAFPFVNMLSYWVYLLSVIVLLASFFVPGGPTGAGWTLYPPQAATQGTPGHDAGIVLMLISLILFVIGFTMGGLNYVTTTLQLRTKGMTLMRMPLAVWGIFVATVLALLAFPALFVGCIMMLLDKLAGSSFFIPTIVQAGQLVQHEGGSPLLFQHLFWYFGHPEVYIVILPAMGVISEIIAVHSRKPVFGYAMMVLSIVVIGALSFLVWAHHLYTSGMNPYFGFVFAVTTLVVAIPSAVKVYNWVLTMWRGNIHFTTPMLFAIAFLNTFLIGGLTGLFLGNVVLDFPLQDTYFVVAHFHMVMGVAAIVAIFAGIYHWYPRVTGRFMNEGWGKIHFWATFLGTYAIFLPMHHIGLTGIPRRYFSFDGLMINSQSIKDLNVFITIMVLVVGAAQLLFGFNLIYSAFKGKLAGENPWRATTLEWVPAYPVPHGNWGEALPPTVHRGPYEYSVPGAKEDFIPQTKAPVGAAGDGGE